MSASVAKQYRMWHNHIEAITCKAKVRLAKKIEQCIISKDAGQLIVNFDAKHNQHRHSSSGMVVADNDTSP